nr:MULTISPECIES: TonB-dependent receptor [Myxococcaceae]
MGGNLGLLRTNTRVEHGSGNASLLLNYGHQRADGYRVHSDSAKDNVLVTGNLRASSRQEISVVGSFNRSEDKLAGQLTSEQFNNEENVAEAAYLANDAYVRIDSVRFGVTHRYDVSSWLRNTSTVYATGYQLAQPFAAGRTDNMAVNLGARTEFALSFAPGGHAIHGVIGAEVQQTNAFKKSYALANGQLGALRGDLQVTSLQSNPVFTEWQVELPAEFALTAGASVNLVRYHIRDNFPVGPTHPSQSGIKEFSPVVTPRVALMRTFDPGFTVYAQVSEGYTPPASSSVVIAQEGRVNTDLRPERGTLFEVGTKGILLSDRLSYEAAVFDMRVKDKLTPEAVTDAGGKVLYSITTNAGQQTNRGLELASRYAVVRDPDAVLSSVEPWVSWTLSRFRYTDFKANANDAVNPADYSGNRVAGVPTYLVNAGVDLATRWGVYLNTTFQRVDRMPLTYDNAHYADGYSLVGAKLGYRADLPKKFHIDAAAGSNNILGARYYTMAFLNANYGTPTSPADPNVYLPGSYKPTYYGGVTLSYTP